MQITKLGHCCLLVEDQEVRMLTDPGIFSVEQASAVRNIHFVLITHEHRDHFHIDSLREVLAHNPSARVVTNRAVGLLLRAEGIPHETLVHGEYRSFGGVMVEGFGEWHAEFHSSLPSVENTGFFLGNKLYYPGDSFFLPPKRPEILALPVAGPWMKIAEAIDFALELRPKLAFPVHDAILKDPKLGSRWPGEVLPGKGVEWRILEEGRGEGF